MLQPVPSPTVSVVIPARDEAATIGAVVSGIVSLGRATEVVVVDDGSTDTTATVAAAAGARVVRADAGPGKGQAMRAGLGATTGEIVVFCDADLEDFDPAYVTGLVDALVADPDAALVKAAYDRAGTGGRVNELVARPVLDLLHPQLGHLAQPLGGEYAAWREVLEQVPFVHGYGVDLGLVLDVAERFGARSVIQVALPTRRHRNRPLDELRPQAVAVLAVALDRAGVETTAPVAACPPLAEAGYGSKSA